GVAGAPAGSLRTTLYSRLDTDGQPSFPERGWSESLELAPGASAPLRPETVGRFLRLEFSPASPPASLELAGVEVLAVPLLAETLLETFERSFSLFAERPLFACRELSASGALGGYERWATYREVWAEVRAVAAGLREALVDPASGPHDRVFVGICAPNQPEWAIADLACLVNAFVVVSLPASETPERLIEMASRCQLACVFSGRAELESVQAVVEAVPSISLVIELPPLDRSPAPAPSSPVRSWAEIAALGEGQAWAPAEREPSSLHTILFSSGSTGSPKGAMRSYEACNKLLVAFGVSQPAVHLSFQPLSHFSERVYQVALMTYGGQIGFATRGDLLYEEFGLLEPTAIGAVPRVYNLLLERYERDLAALREELPEAALELLEEEAMAGLRGVFGRRVQSVSVGSAPPSRALMRFLRRCFDFCRVGEGYGSTECATITVDDVVRGDVELRLIDVPELGYSTSDQPPRGEILVRTPHMVSGYLGDEEATRANFDEDGFFRTGDLGERREDGRVLVIGRRKNVVKLAQGEFVAPERIEGALMTSTLVAQVMVHADSLQSSVVAIVVPSLGALATAIGCEESDLDALAGPRATAHVLADLREVGQGANLLPFELPSAVHLELKPLSVERGFATSSNKLDRRAIAAHYGEVFASLYEGAAPTASVLDLVREAAASILGSAPAPNADLADQLGVDSLSSVELVSAVSERLSREIPLSAWHGASSLEELARRIQVHAGVGAAQAGNDQGTTAELALADLNAPLPLDDLVLQGPPPPLVPRVVLLTGVTGFLGAHLLEALLRSRDGSAQPLEVRCLIRAADDEAARERLQAAAERFELEVSLEGVVALAGDLGQERLGWDADRWARQATELDSILHAGAQVNWVMLYGQLRTANVIGTDTLLELAGASRLKAFHLVSTISTAPAGGDEESSLREESALRSSGYGLSKWVSERRVAAAGARGLPLTIHRPAMITGHSRRGVANPEDFVNRYLRTCLALGIGLDLQDARCDLTPVDSVADGIVALIRSEEARGRTFHLTSLEKSPTWAELSDHLGVSPVPYDEFRAALIAAGASVPLAPLRAWFPASGFRMQMGPWPCADTDARLEALGVAQPPPAADLVAAYARFHQRGEGS
ncbi:MAG: thioester reductase domain-containing protein, partial [Planctomycetes bacterium]|nr:thioester reductase domain-containing protein [Planctomycetota bacterium]